MKIDSYDWFVDREKGRPCLVAGSAPTIKDFPFKDFNGVYVAMGDLPLRMRNVFTTNYWMAANDEFPVPEIHSDIINSFDKTVFIFADSVTYSRKWEIDPVFLDKTLKVDWFAYDQRHFDGRPCVTGKKNCCKLLELYPGRLTLQEFIQNKYGMKTHYSTGSTVAIHALAFAMILGCNPIYLQGIELPLFKNDYKYKDDRSADSLTGAKVNYLEKTHKLLNPMAVSRFIYRQICDCLERLGLIRQKSPFYVDIPNIMADFEYLIEICMNKNISVFNLSQTSTLNKISTLQYKKIGI